MNVWHGYYVKPSERLYEWPPHGARMVYRKGRKSGVEVWRLLRPSRLTMFFICVFNGDNFTWTKLNGGEFNDLGESWDVSSGNVKHRPKFPVRRKG
jgi:hypothetical protein